MEEDPSLPGCVGMNVAARRSTSSTLLGRVMEEFTHLGRVMGLDSCRVHLMHFALLIAELLLALD